MSPTTQALLICVVFLCGLEDAVLALHGHCADNRCFVLLRESEDFPGAQRRCSGKGGQLLTIRPEQAEETLTGPLSGHSGSYWLELQGDGRKPEEAPADLGNCSSVSMSGEGNIVVSGKQCRNRLDGFLCQYTFQDPCSRIKADGGAQVRYTTHMGFDVNDSEAFPPGTIAVVDKVGGKYLDSKHVCASGVWARAPWGCEVFKGGCEHSCNQTTRTCICPEGQALHPNSITCAKDPSDGFPHAGGCARGYKLAQDGKRCVDVDECKEGGDPCTAEGQECLNTEGGFECRCRDGFDMEEGACVDVAICIMCEHMLCVKPTGVYECACREGFRVSAKDPTKCKRHCTERDCEAVCTDDKDVQSPDMLDCECPEGYIRDMRNGTAICTDIDECVGDSQCDHKCENAFGGYRCVCFEGYRLQGNFECVPTEEEDGGSGAFPLHPVPATAHPAAVPSYIRTGSVLGITVFMALCAALLCVVVHTIVKRCGRFELSSFRRPDIDVFYLQQVTTETYKRLSFDKQFKGDLQRL
ncbi:thrombomodulin-like [Hippoglossus hippoglossus]|uniref:thrombomodulin-like n=1 Tax=Hippoglossus hippoglossus TaxID=8267 RepID=UPI00148CEE3F|nr:thrombomodulin-like [Hippoglossus hippoglossus]